MASSGSTTITDFERAFDDLFEELLISRWECGRDISQYRQALVLDLGVRYEIRIAFTVVRPHEVEVEATDRRLTVRIRPGGARVFTRTFEFAAAIDGDAVSAHWADGVLRVSLPKRKPARIEIRKPAATT
ncbi:MAG: Hsp20/alpha crystallin family protein [Candidatus Binataceae bacterium]